MQNTKNILNSLFKPVFLQLSIIIVNFNVKYFLEQCLWSVRRAIEGIEAEVIIVDNASSDGSVEYLLSIFPEFIFIDNPKNLGFARANNQGFKQARGNCILFLNPDTILSEDCLRYCISFLAVNSQSGACGVQMLDGSGKFLPESKRAFPSIETSFYKLTGLARLFPRSKRFARYYIGDTSVDKDQQVDVLSGAFMMVKKEVLQVTGGFDEQFFMYGEDIDLSYRIQQAGYKNYYLAGSRIIHFKGESTIKGSLNYVRLFYKAMSIFVKKHYGNKATGITSFIHLSIWFRAGAAALSKMLSGRKNIPAKGSSKTMIIGTELEASSVISIMAKRYEPANVIELQPGTDWENEAWAKMPDEIILCQGKLSYNQIIYSIIKLPETISIKIHSKGSFSIVGSRSKSRNGDVIA